MQTSTELKNIFAALVSFHKEVGKIGKDAKNPFFKSSYASLSGILDAISEPLTNNGLAIVQFPDGQNGLTTRLIHQSGEWMEATYTMQPVKNTPQDAGSVITYQRRYAIGAILSLNIDEDDDANKATGKQLAPTKAVSKAKQKLADTAFKQAIERIDKGEKDLIAKLYDNYDLTVEQMKVLDDKSKAAA